MPYYLEKVWKGGKSTLTRFVMWGQRGVTGKARGQKAVGKGAGKPIFSWLFSRQREQLGRGAVWGSLLSLKGGKILRGQPIKKKGGRGGKYFESHGKLDMREEKGDLEMTLRENETTCRGEQRGQRPLLHLREKTRGATALRGASPVSGNRLGRESAEKLK